MTQTTGPYCMICGGPAPCARHTFTQAEGEIGKWGNPQTTAPLPQIEIPIDKDKEIARLTKLVIYYAEQSGVSESVVRKTWKI